MEKEKRIPYFLPFPKISEEKSKKIHAASLEILKKVGVRLELKEAVDLLKKAGAKIKNDGMVCVPPKLVEEALRTAPKMVTLFNRHGHPVMPIKDHVCFYGPGSDCLNIIDHVDGGRRKPMLRDVVDGAVLCDALEQIDFVMSMVLPSDVDMTIADRYQMEIMLAHTSKPIIFVSYEFAGCVDCVEMAEAVAGGIDTLQKRPNIACYINVISGLLHNKDALQKLLYLSSKKIPALYIPSSTGGVTSPITPAGSLAMDYAGVLAGVVLSQLQQEGAPIIIPGMAPGQLDMRTMISTYCEPERGQGQSMAHFYGLPMFSLGGASEAKVVDQQAAAEAALTLMSETLAGGNIIHDLGYLESGLTFSFAHLMICTEIVSWIKGFLKEISVDDDSLALDLIAEKGSDGQYLDTEHTHSHFRERWYPDLFERKTYDAWVYDGEKTLAQRAGERVERILEEHNPEPLPQDVMDKLREIVGRASSG
jgi:trimethylamine--corrinoid protein Co-methyltransferase